MDIRRHHHTATGAVPTNLFHLKTRFFEIMHYFVFPGTQGMVTAFQFTQASATQVTAHG